jgi:endoglucanase
LTSVRPLRLVSLGLAAIGVAVGIVVLLSAGHANFDRQARHGSTDPLGSLRLWVSPQSPAAAQVAAWQTSGDTADATAIERIATEPTARWLAGEQRARATAAGVVRAAAEHRSVAQLILYNIPGRDCQSYSSGGATSGDAYLRWVSEIAHGIGRYPAIVLLEPDAIDQAAGGCLPRNEVAARYQLLSHAVAILKSDPRVFLYLDAGNSDWLPATQMVGPLRMSGIDRANGFALNVANFQTTRASIAYGRSISRRLGGRHFVIDTSRNGNGPPYGSGVDRWCNPPGRALGEPPTTNTGDRLVDAFLWVKYPGESDGSCHRGDPPAGAWWPAYALALARAGG